MSQHDPDATRVDLPSVDPTSVFAPAGASGPPTGPLPPVQRGSSGPPPPDRRLWILVGLLGAIVVVLILLLVLKGDDGDEDGAAGSTTTSELTTSTSTSSTTSSTTSTTAATTTTTEAPPGPTPTECRQAGVNPAQPGRVAETVFEAWVRDDAACAAELMDDAALEELFSRDGESAQDQFQGCTGGGLLQPEADCAFTYEGVATHYLMDFRNGQGWRISDITQVAD